MLILKNIKQKNVFKNGNSSIWEKGVEKKGIKGLAW